ncbi:MAG TPA: alanine--tRNA ligase [Candidatus Saccharimonadales bacterium]|nr:alanine--tRNA ligase [Candidatus Saccharimonadales bacterium]
MTAKELKAKYLGFFEKKGHKVISSAPLTPEHDPTVLFTTAGMHPLVPFLLGQEHPSGKRLTNVQKCLRTDDIDDVGDNSHNTFFEMLGNWSLGDYWKKEAIEWSWEFLTKELMLSPERISVTVFGGDQEIPGVSEDSESIEIWKSLGVAEERIYKLGKEDNWWGPVGESGPCGSDTEMFYDTGKAEHGQVCRPGENCGKYVEIWNDVFMEYNKTKTGTYEKLKQRNVDTGMGVERATAVLQGRDNVFETELFSPVLELIRTMSESYNETSARIVADHLRAAIFLISDGVAPSNTERGYVLRRLIRRVIRHGRLLGIKASSASKIAETFIEIYKEDYPELIEKAETIFSEINKEEEKFQKVIAAGLREFEKLGKEISGKDVFRLYESYGFPPELTYELASEKGIKINHEDFEQELKRHQDVSRAGMEKKFSGGLADHSDITVRGHTATHLLHQALRDVLGKSVHQSGSNITPERIRFDFAYGEKMTPEQIKKVEDIVNSKIKEDLKVKKELTTQEEADRKGAIGLFKDKYEDKVSIYEIGDYSTEYCGGPHVEHTSEVGKFKIIKEESISAGQRRIKATLS